MTDSPFQEVTTVAKKKSAKKAAPKAKTKTKAKSAKKAAPKAAKKPAKKAAAKASAKKPVAKPAKKSAPKVSPRQMTAKATAKTAGKAPAPASATKSRFGQPLDKIFIPLDDRLIIENEAEEERTAGGLIIPDSIGASEGPKKGKVVAVGRGHRDKKGRIRPLDVQLGDTVMFEAYVGAPMKIGDRELVVLRESQLLGVVK